MRPKPRPLRRRSEFERFSKALEALAALLAYPDTAQAIERTGNVFAHSIRAAIGPDELERHARERYIAGEISADELSAEIERIETETWRPNT